LWSIVYRSARPATSKLAPSFQRDRCIQVPCTCMNACSVVYDCASLTSSDAQFDPQRAITHNAALLVLTVAVQSLLLFGVVLTATLLLSLSSLGHSSPFHCIDRRFDAPHSTRNDDLSVSQSTGIYVTAPCSPQLSNIGVWLYEYCRYTCRPPCNL